LPPSAGMVIDVCGQPAQGPDLRIAFFTGANDPYKSLKIALNAEIDEDAWATLYRDASPVSASRDGPILSQNYQSLRRQGDEGVRGVGDRDWGSNQWVKRRSQ
jgi:hypothetical protein